MHKILCITIISLVWIYWCISNLATMCMAQYHHLINTLRSYLICCSVNGVMHKTLNTLILDEGVDYSTSIFIKIADKKWLC